MLQSTKKMAPTEISKFNLKVDKDFDSSISRQLAELIQQSYLQFDKAQLLQQNVTITPWKITGDYEHVADLGTNKNPFGFIAKDNQNNNIYIIFRGTKKIVEWFKDANIQPVSYACGMNENGKVNISWQILEDSIDFANDTSTNIDRISDDFGLVIAGFRGIYVSLRQQLISALQTLDVDRVSQIYVTGHSLGGALATLAIPDILINTQFKNHQQITLYTFASPRCGDNKFAANFEKTGVKHWRIANTEDFVTTVPFPTGNVFQPADPNTPPEKELGIGGVTGVDANPNPIYGFFKAIFDRKKRRMPNYVHTGTPIYFTIYDGALERHHNLEEVYMLGISVEPLEPRDPRNP